MQKWNTQNWNKWGLDEQTAKEQIEDAKKKWPALEKVAIEMMRTCPEDLHLEWDEFRAIILAASKKEPPIQRSVMLAHYCYYLGLARGLKADAN